MLLLFRSLSAPRLKFFRELRGNRDFRETAFGLAPGTNLSLVDCLLDLDLATLRIETAPPQSEKFSGPLHGLPGKFCTS